MQLFAETTSHEITHPVLKDSEGNPLSTGLVVELLPADHDAIYQAGISLFKSLRGKADAIEADALTIENRIKILESAVVGWTIKEANVADWLTQFKKMGFEDVEFSKEKLHTLLSYPTASWLRTQIDKVVGEKERFFTNGLKS